MKADVVAAAVAGMAIGLLLVAVIGGDKVIVDDAA